MNTGDTLEVIGQQLANMKSNKLDIMVNTGNPTLRAVNYGTRKDGELDNNELSDGPRPRGVMLDIHNPRTNRVEPFGLNNLARAQIAQHLGIPKKYCDTLADEQPDLLAQNINDRMKYTPADRMIRTLDGKVRAFLSNGYRAIDTDQLFEAVWPTISALKLDVKSAKLTERNFYLKATHREMTGEIAVGKMMRAGFMMKSSDVGCGEIQVCRWYEECICTNGWVVEKTLGQRHIGRKTEVGNIDNSREHFTDETRQAEDKAFVLKFRDSVAAIFNPVEFDKSLDRFRKAKAARITAPLKEVVEHVADKYRFTDDEAGSVLDHLARGGDPTKFGLAAAITRTAEDLDDYDRVTEFEARGTQLVDMTGTEWSKFAISNN